MESTNLEQTRGHAPPAGDHGPPKRVLDALQSCRRPIVFGHVAPDADCLGSAMGLVETLRERGVDAVFGLPDGAGPKRLRFMFDLVPECPRTSVLPDDRDLVVTVDTASEKRVNFDRPPAFAAVPASLNIDHHITNTDFARVNWVDPHASSTSELIAQVVSAMGTSPTPAVASLLFAGIHGDTAGFSLPGTSAEALETAAALVRHGADVAHIGEQLCRSQERGDFELLRRVYDHTTTTPDGQISYSFLTYDDITASRCTADDIDDQVSIPRALRGVRVAMLFSEGEPGVIRINLRGEGSTSVLEIARHFGGGGHTQSAGIRVREKPMPQVIEEVLSVTQAHLSSLDGP